MIVSGLMAFLAALLASAWAGMGRPAAELVSRSQLIQEINLTVAALSRDLGGNSANPEARLGGKKLGRWVDWRQPDATQLWLCFDGGTDLDGLAQWGAPDTVIIYEYQPDSKTLVRRDQTAGTAFTVAGNVESMEIQPQGSDAVSITLSFQHRQLSHTCTLIAKLP